MNQEMMNDATSTSTTIMQISIIDLNLKKYNMRITHK